MPRASRASRLLGTLRAALALARVAARAVGLYSRLRLRLWVWRRLSARRFSGALRGLPGGLRAELEAMYRRETGSIRLPGIVEAARAAAGLRRARRGVSRRG